LLVLVGHRPIFARSAISTRFRDPSRCAHPPCRRVGASVDRSSEVPTVPSPANPEPEVARRGHISRQ
jgi:hypothetical protein